MKTTKNGAFSFEDINIEGKQTSKMIHKHQILALMEYAKYDNVVSGFLFNFRSESDNIERTYFQYIDDFMEMVSDIGKKSFNEKDLISHNPIEIKGIKKRVNYKWDIGSFLSKQQISFASHHW